MFNMNLGALTLAGLRQWVANALTHKNCKEICPVCDQMIKIYVRPITIHMAKQLERLYYATGPIYAQDLQADKNGNERKYSLLRWWDLAQGDGNGNWEITDFGRAFIEGKVSVPERVYLFNNKSYPITGDPKQRMVRIKDIYPGLRLPGNNKQTTVVEMAPTP